MKGADLMPRIIPIRDLKDTAAISQMCSESPEPIYITKNGYGDMVIMSMKAYEEKLFMADVYLKLAEAEAEVREGKVSDAREGLRALRDKYGL
jgi:PHD/YefM family antitoxin component YafN of YafNO toxin-antitoxin module